MSDPIDSNVVPDEEFVDESNVVTEDSNVVPEEEFVDEEFVDESNVVTEDSNIVPEEEFVDESNVVTEEEFIEESNVVTEDSNVMTEDANVAPETTTTTTPSHTIKVARFELYPKEAPTCYCVGFSVTCNNQTIYRDTQVPLETAADCGCETEIAQQAYNSLKESLESWIADAQTKSPLIGQTFVPSV